MKLYVFWDERRKERQEESRTVESKGGRKEGRKKGRKTEEDDALNKKRLRKSCIETQIHKCLGMRLFEGKLMGGREDRRRRIRVERIA